MLFIYEKKSVIVFSISRKDIHQRSDVLRKFGGGSSDNKDRQSTFILTSDRPFEERYRSGGIQRKRKTSV